MQSSVFPSPKPVIIIKPLSVLPPQIDLSHLHGNKKLFSDEEIENIHSDFLQNAGTKSSRYQSSLIPKKIHVIKLSDNNLYAIYYGKKQRKGLGQGCFGKVKLMQSLSSGAWHALKLSTSMTSIKTYEAEIANLKTMEKLIATSEEINPKTRMRRHLIAMQFEKGIALDQFLVKNMPEFPILLITMIKMSQAVADCHAKGLWHGDIKPENFLIDPSTYDVTLIDFGFSLPQNKKNNYAGKSTAGHAAYEINRFSDQMDLNLTEKTEINALGISFARMIDAAVNSAKIGRNEYKRFVWFRVAGNHQLSKLTCKIIPYENFRNEFLDYLRRMTHEDPAMRPTLAETKTYLNLVLNKLNIKEAIINVGMINLNQLIHAFSANQSLLPDMINQLKEMNYVSLITNDCTQAELAGRVHYQLTQLGITVQNCIYYADQASFLTLVKEAKNAIAHDSPFLQKFYCFTNEKLSHEQRVAIKHEGISINTSPSAPAAANRKMCLVS